MTTSIHVYNLMCPVFLHLFSFVWCSLVKQVISLFTQLGAVKLGVFSPPMFCSCECRSVVWTGQGPCHYISTPWGHHVEQ